MFVLDFLQSNFTAYITFVALLGLIVGSFLNVVILRLPKMMENDWHAQCRELLEIQSQPPDVNLTLSKPDSHCPKCQHKIRAWENIPIVSYLLLRGRCSQCSNRISPRYPLIEFATAVLSVVVAWYFGFSWQAVGGILLTWALVALAVIDFDTQLLPDSITLPFLWVGLVFNLGGTFTDTQSSVIGAMAGYMLLWSLYHLFKLATGKEGMGYGDFKLLAMLGAWLGWQALAAVILLSSVVGAVVGVSLILFLGRDRNIPIPFGPYLAAAGWITLVWGQQLNQWYWSWVM